WALCAYGEYSDASASADARRRPLLTSAAMSVIRLAAPAFPAVLPALSFAGCGAPSRPRATIALVDCRLPKLPLAAQCGSLEVPENRDKPDGRKISLFVAVLPAN